MSVIRKAIFPVAVDQPYAVFGLHHPEIGRSLAAHS
jgi:hypothetical protein